MSLIAFILVIISTIAHAFWNYLGKKQESSAAYFELAMLFASVCLSPILLIYWHALPLISLRIWGLLLITGICQSIYFAGLAGAYRHGQLSIVYPLARALPVLGVTAISVLLNTGAPISPAGFTGIFLVSMGCFFVPIESFSSLKLKDYLNIYVALAVLAAVGTVGYTIIDNEALRSLREIPQFSLSVIETAFLYMVLETAITALVLGIYILFSPTNRSEFVENVKTKWRPAILTGLIINLTYGLVLAAMGYVTNISYLSAFRQLSIPIGALFGITLQKEPAGRSKLIGIVLVLSGLLIIGLS